MSELIKISLGSLALVANGLPVQGQAGVPTATATVVGAGAVSATVVVRGSNDGVAWVSLATLSPTGTGSGVASGTWSGDYAQLRADVTAISAGAVASSFVSVDQTGAGQSAGGSSAAAAPVTKVQVANRTGTPNLVQANTGTAGQTGKGNLQYGNCGLKTVPISGAGSGMTPGEYPLTISGGTPTTAATGTYTVGAGGTCTGVTITFPGIGYNTAPTVAAGGSPGGTLPTFTSTIGNTAQEFNSFQSVTITEDCTDLEFTFANFAANTSAPGQTDAGPSALTLRVGARVVGVATTYPLFSQNGGRDIILEPDEEVTTKSIPGPFKKGDVVMLQVYGRYASIPTHWPVSTGMWQSRGDEVAEFGTNLTDHSLRTSAIPGAVHSSNWAICPPIEVRGRVLSNTNKRFAGFGDSIMTSGANDSGSGGYIGFFQRAVAANYGFVNLGASGYGVTAFMTSSRAARMRKYRALADAGITHAFTNWVTNDLSGAASAAVVTTILTNLNALRDELLAFGIKLIPMTCCPRTNTSNDGVNAADTAGAWGYRRTFNDAIRANNGVGFGFFDLALHTQDSVNQDIWDVALDPVPVDGIHPNGPQHEYIALQFAAALPSLLAN